MAPATNHIAALLRRRRRRAITLLQESCDDTYAWLASGTGADWVSAFQADALRNGTAGLYMKTRTVGAAEHDTLTTYKAITLPKHGIIEFSLWCRWRSTAGCSHFDVELRTGIAGRARYPRVIWYPAGGTVSVLNDGGTYNAIASLLTVPVIGTWYHVTLTIDTVNATYYTHQIDAKTGNLWGYNLYDDGVMTSYSSTPLVKLATTASPPATIDIDDITVRWLRTNR